MIMSVTLIDKKSFILSDYCTTITTTSKKQSQKLLLHGRNEVKNDIPTLNDDDPNLHQANYLDSHSIINTIQKTPIKERKRKHSGSTSSSVDSSFTSSCEIKFGSPVQYKLCNRNDTTIILKKVMNRKSERKPKICNDEDIVNIINCDDEEKIYDGDQRVNKSNRKSLAKNKTANIRSPLVKTLRRSTEQSHYKIKTSDDDTYTRRVALRSTSMRYAEEDNGLNIRVLPTRAAKSKLYGENNESSPVNSPRKTGTSKHKRETHNKTDDNNVNKSKIASSGASILKSISATPVEKRKSRRNSVLSSINDRDDDDDDEVSEECESDEMNKENESDDSNYSDKYENITRQNDEMKFRNEQVITPQKKSRAINNVTTPKRTSQRTKTNDIVSNGTPIKMSKIIEHESATPKRKMRVIKSQTPSVKIGTLTPSMRPRKTVIEKPETIFATVRAQLHVSAVPKSLPCRENEFNDIFTFLERKLVDESGGCMYISGVPGTGKTATVNEAIRCLKRLVAKGTIEHFNYIEINGMKLTEPRQAYVQILKQLTGETVTWEVAHSTIEKILTNSNDKMPMTLLLIDELDLLCNKRQDVVYNLLDWPSQPAAKLVVVTIANTMDLPERVLMSRVTSRLGLTRLTFQPYDHKQLQEIVIARLNESDLFKSDAVQLVARKVAAVSGDARRALDICRRATEIAEFDQSKIVSMQHVNETLIEMIASVKVRAVMHCSEMEKVFLQAICAEIQRTGVEETIFNNVYKQFQALCTFEGEKTPNMTESLEICARLSAKRLILCNDSKRDIEQKIFLNVSADDIHFALKNI